MNQRNLFGCEYCPETFPTNDEARAHECDGYTGNENDGDRTTKCLVCGDSWLYWKSVDECQHEPEDDGFMSVITCECGDEFLEDALNSHALICLHGEALAHAYRMGTAYGIRYALIYVRDELGFVEIEASDIFRDAMNGEVK